MRHNFTPSRRWAIKSSVLGILSVSVPNVIYAKNILEPDPELQDGTPLPSRYPSIDDEIVSEVVGKSHFDLERVKELVDHRPELARANWDWAFGDWESAIGAAAHVGRRDIVEYLLGKGARPNIFTYAVLGHYEVVKRMIETQPGVENIDGPHGIGLLVHAEAGLRMKEDLTAEQIENSERLVAYLKGLESIQEKPYLEMTEAKEPYLGDYMYGDGEADGFSIKLNMRDMLSLGRLGAFGGGLYKLADNRFTYNGTPSVEVSFQVEEGKVVSLTVHEPDLTLKAMKV